MSKKTPSRKPGWPDGKDDVINKYGTYEVQATADMENPYPMIAQGLPTQWLGASGDSHPSQKRPRGKDNPPGGGC